MVLASTYLPTDAPKVNVAFGELLATIRKRKGLSQTALADAAGFSRATIANLELGKQNVQLNQLFALAGALNSDPRELLPEVRTLSSTASSQADTFITLAKLRLATLVEAAE